MSGWVTVGYVPHIPKSFGHTAPARLTVSDARNEVIQRCLAIVMRRFIRASETGYPVELNILGRVLLVPRVGGGTVDKPEERSIYALMGHMCDQFCTPCMVSRPDSCLAGAETAPRG